MHATHNTLSENVRAQGAEPHHRTPVAVAYPLQRLDAWRNEGGAGRAKLL